MSCEKLHVDKSVDGHMRVQYEIRFLLFTLSKWYHINTQQSVSIENSLTNSPQFCQYEAQTAGGNRPRATLTLSCLCAWPLQEILMCLALSLQREMWNRAPDSNAHMGWYMF